MQKEVTQCKWTSIEGERFGAHFGVLAKGRGLHNSDIYIFIYIFYSRVWEFKSSLRFYLHPATVTLPFKKIVFLFSFLKFRPTNYY